MGIHNTSHCVMSRKSITRSPSASARRLGASHHGGSKLDSNHCDAAGRSELVSNTMSFNSVVHVQSSPQFGSANTCGFQVKSKQSNGYLADISFRCKRHRRVQVDTERCVTD
ncbi:hypothetical protein TNCV_714341 [Trichonephila clavipes]|nr:hypothetical protein TNCV_714341 [Trichonephila clavipes]